jgi:hypothetical protein
MDIDGWRSVSTENPKRSANSLSSMGLPFKCQDGSKEKFACN